MNSPEEPELVLIERLDADAEAVDPEGQVVAQLPGRDSPRVRFERDLGVLPDHEGATE